MIETIALRIAGHDVAAVAMQHRHLPPQQRRINCPAPGGEGNGTHEKSDDKKQ
ncbi:hypothetical protein [Mesorhizobium sp. WSM2561]|uniref:hypothetical protein n=1 Tax=Mesorhizobium sp. WSM2561 TaxID=1040985 RepID=UPI0012EB3FD5|nr:hypothetical protein [Mesorhizobium sp. WSM2561]